MIKAKYDSFISYAGDDKSILSKPLANKLRNEGLNIWFDDFELNPGDSLTEKISSGLNQSKFGICIFSPAFFKKPWPQFEIKGMVQLLLSNKLRIIPIWFNVSHKDVIRYNPSLGDLVAIKADGENIEEVFLKVLRVLSPEVHNKILRKMAFDYVARTTEEQKAKLSEIKHAEIKHPTLPDSAISRTNLICKCFENLGLEFMKPSIFIDNLKRDTHYENELLIWEKIAAYFLEYTSKNNFTLAQNREIFRLLVAKASGMDLSFVDESRVLPEEVKVKLISDNRLEEEYQKLKKKY